MKTSNGVKLIITAIIIAAAGVLVLSRVGNLFISEVTKEIKIEERGAVLEAGIGKPAPHFELSDLEGNNKKLSDFLGSPLILTFWTTWNTVSADQIKILDDYSHGDSKNLFKIITISSQEDKSVIANFIGRGGYKINVLLDDVGIATGAYKARNLPATYFIDKNGIIQDIFIGILSKSMLVDKAEQLLK